MKIPDNALYILKTLEDNGFEGYVVGGCVRDMVLGREPEDWDITTSARPEQVKALFRRTVDTGIRHGTVTVMLGREGYEVTTYRMDGEYEDHRHPSEVSFTPELSEDLKRRDFTINAMAYNPACGIVDMFDGMGDIERRRIRCVGDAAERFEEDALRMLRGIRFAGQLSFEIEEKTLDAIREKAPTIVNVSAERIRAELTKLLLSDGADRLILAAQTGLCHFFLPEFDEMLRTPQKNPHHMYDVGRHTIEAVRHVNELWRDQGGREEKSHTALAYAALLHDVAKPDCLTTDGEGIDHFHHHNERGAEKAEKILKRLKFDNGTVATVCKIIRYHDRRYKSCLSDGAYTEKGKGAMRRLMNLVGCEAMPLLFMLQRADLLAQSDHHRGEKIKTLEAGERCFHEIQEAGDAVTRDGLMISGSEIIALGVKPGPEVGGILQQLLEAVMDRPERNTPEELRGLAKEIIADRQ